VGRDPEPSLDVVHVSESLVDQVAVPPRLFFLMLCRRAFFFDVRISHLSLSPHPLRGVDFLGQNAAFDF